MTNSSHNLKKLITIGSAVFALLAAPMVVNHVTGLGDGFIASAQAADNGSGSGGSGGSGQHQKGKSEATGGSHGGGGAMGNKIFRAPVSSEEDSDRPAWAGVKGGKAGGGGQPAGAGTKKGDLFGDMVVLLRDANGVPILVDGLAQVVAFIYDSNGNLIPLTNPDGSLVVIPYNADGDLETQVTLGTTTYDVYPAEVDLGRLSVGRSPTKVLSHSLEEALAKLTETGAVITLDASGRLVVNGVAIDSPLENLALYDAYMTGQLTIALPAGFDPAALLAAAADKTGTITVDTVVYMNSILGINKGTTYYDFSSYDYDRADTWGDVKVTVLVLQSDGSYVPQEVNVYDAVFSSTNWVDPTYNSTTQTDAGGADDFAAAANDYLQVIEFVHDNAVR
jgi:hypothetical protein